jgi:hypothetical protein
MKIIAIILTLSWILIAYELITAPEFDEDENPVNTNNDE